jgi:hypothetical protein
MDNNFWIVVLLVVAILVIAFVYRQGGFKAGLKGRGGPKAEAPTPAAPAPGPAPPPSPTAGTHASGAGSVAIGGSADEAKISTKVQSGQ